MVKASNLSWIVVSDIKKAKKFFTESIGLKELSSSEEFGWVELGGESGGAVIGLAQASPEMEKEEMGALKPGDNAVITLTVDNIEKTTDEFKEKKIPLIGEQIEVPGHVKLQLFKDLDGNLLQIVEMLDK